MLKLKPEILTRNGEKQFAILRWEDFEKVQEELEDLADLRALDKARAKEGHLPGISLAELNQRLDAKFGKRPKSNGRKSR